MKRLFGKLFGSLSGKLFGKLFGQLLAVAVITALLAGCAGQNPSNASPSNTNPSNTNSSNTNPSNTNSSTTNPSNTSQTPVTVGILQMIEHPSLGEVRVAIIEELIALGYGHVDVHYMIGQGDMGSLTTIAQTFVGNAVDIIVPIATPAAQATAGVTTEIPIVFSAVADPIAAGLVATLEHPDTNITGVSNVIEVEPIFALARALAPDATVFGLVYNIGEINAVAIINDAKEYMRANGFTYLEAPITGTAEVQQAAQSLVGHVDAFFMPNDNTVAAAMPVYAQVAIEAGLPIFTTADSTVRDGGLATVGINYTVLGQRTAQMIVDVLNGTAIADIPVYRQGGMRTVVNADTAARLGIDFSVLGADVEVY